MGNTRRLRKKYDTPSHMWEKERIPEEKELLKEYGLKNKKEIWKMGTILTKFKNIVKEAIASRTEQSEKENAQLMARLKSLGLLNDASVLGDVLKLADKDVLERRLQTVVFRIGLARSVNQARQFITHGHIKIDGVTISSPAYMVKKEEEAKLTFDPNSSLANEDHPERNLEKALLTKKEESKKEEGAADKKSAEKAPADKKKENKSE